MSTNPYKLLRDLLPDAPLQVGTVQSISGGVATLLLQGGGIATARGDATVGQRVFFRDNAIEGTAPSLTIEIIEI
jgi:hypothetical protein